MFFKIFGSLQSEREGLLVVLFSTHQSCPVDTRVPTGALGQCADLRENQPATLTSVCTGVVALVGSGVALSKHGEIKSDHRSYSVGPLKLAPHHYAREACK